MKTFKDFLNEQSLIMENRIDFLKNLYKDKLSTDHDTFAEHHDSDSIVQHFADNADPSRNKKHTQWILTQYRKGNIRQEDAPRIHETLSNFDRHQSRLPNRQLEKYAHINDLERDLEPHLNTTVTSKRQELKQFKSDGADLIHSENGVTVHRLKTKEAACQYGKGTKWCTAAENNNMFDRYNKSGPLYVVNTPGSGGSRKYQFHFEAKQYMDETDKRVDLNLLTKQHPELKHVKEFQGKKLELTNKPGDYHDELMANDDDYFAKNIDRVKPETISNELSTGSLERQHIMINHIPHSVFKNLGLSDEIIKNHHDYVKKTY